MRQLRVLAVAMVSVAGLAVAAPTAHAVDECLRTPWIGGYGNPGEVAPLTTTNGEAIVNIAFSGDWYPPDYCSGVTVTAQKTDGTLRRVVPLDERGGVGHPPALFIIGRVPIPLSNGAGDWVVTKVSRGTESITVSVPFRVRRGTTATLEQPATVTSPAKTLITGVVRHYGGTGTLVPSPGRVVRILKPQPIGSGMPPIRLGTVTTDRTGRYRAYVAISAPVSFQVSVDLTAQFGGATTGTVTARVWASLSPLTATPQAYIGRWWGVSGTAYPTRLATHLWLWNGAQWVSTYSIGVPATDGRFTRWWKPATAGTYRLRVSFGEAGEGPENVPLYREVSVVVSPRPTSLTGTTDATTATVIRPGTKMSTYGHLRVMYTSGTTGAFGNQQVVVQTRPRGQTATPYRTVGTATTTGTGYYYANWNVQADVDVRVAFLSPYQSIGSSFRWIRAVDVR